MRTLKKRGGTSSSEKKRRDEKELEQINDVFEQVRSHIKKMENALKYKNTICPVKTNILVSIAYQFMDTNYEFKRLGQFHSDPKIRETFHRLNNKLRELSEEILEVNNTNKLIKQKAAAAATASATAKKIDLTVDSSGSGSESESKSERRNPKHQIDESVEQAEIDALFGKPNKKQTRTKRRFSLSSDSDSSNVDLKRGSSESVRPKRLHATSSAAAKPIDLTSDSSEKRPKHQTKRIRSSSDSSKSDKPKLKNRAANRRRIDSEDDEPATAYATDPARAAAITALNSDSLSDIERPKPKPKRHSSGSGDSDDNDDSDNIDIFIKKKQKQKKKKTNKKKDRNDLIVSR